MKNWIDINIEKLVPADWNYKKDDSKLSEKLKNNIKRNGQIENIIVRELDTGFFEVVNGNHRLSVFKELGLVEAKCYNLGKISLSQAQRIAIETNETRFQTDEFKLDELLKELLTGNEINELLETIPFDKDYLERLCNIDLSSPIRDSGQKNYLDDIENSQDEDKDFLTETSEAEDKCLFAYYGGKQRIATKIIPLIPKHTVYCEPFAGGASVLFMKPWPSVTNSIDYREVINDTNLLVYTFYQQFRDNTEELVKRISLTPYSEKDHAESIIICKNPEKYEPVIVAWAFFVNINTSFSKTLSNGWGRAVFTSNLSYTWYSRIENCFKLLNRMQGVHISNVDAIKCIQQWDSPQTFFFIDPPYVGTDMGHYKGYTQDDLNLLIATLKNIDGSFILTGYQNNSYPADWETYYIKTVNSASGKGKAGNNRNKSEMATDLGDREREEVILRKLSNKALRPEIQKLYDSGKFDCFTG